MHQNRSYLIFPVSELTKVDFSLVRETSIDTVRKSLDQTKTFIKWDGDEPGFVSTLLNTEGPYTHSEILQILQGVEWTDDSEII